ncbi:MAG: hypothetical protein ACTSVU_01805 [Promethearchaeota archaeon]
MEKAIQHNKQDLDFLFNQLSGQLTETEKHLENISYQIEFFGDTPQLKMEKKDCEIMLGWIQDQFDEIKKALFRINARKLEH